MQMPRSSRMHDSIMLIFTTFSGDDRLDIIENVISAKTRIIIYINITLLTLENFTVS